MVNSNKAHYYIIIKDNSMYAITFSLHSYLLNFFHEIGRIVNATETQSR